MRIKTYYFYKKKNHIKRNCFKKTIKVTKKWIETFKNNAINDHEKLSWIIYYDDKCRIYKSSKNLSSWYFKQKKSIDMINKFILLCVSYFTKYTISIIIKISIKKKKMIALINKK